MSPAGRILYNKAFRVMGGWGQLRFVSDRGAGEAERIARRAMDEAERIEKKYSRFREDSVVSRVNRAAGGTPVPVDEETLRLVRQALGLAVATAGAFDPTVGVLRRAWDFRSGVVPQQADLDRLLPLVDYRQVAERDGLLWLRREGMELDLGGVGKEYAVDRLRSVLREEGVESAVVNLAGDVATLGGRKDGRPWKIGVADPREKGRCRFTVRVVGDAGVASSGDYERFFIKDGIRYHHILDARTGWPARGVAAATVVAAGALEAGLAATAAILLGPDAGLEHLRARPGLEGALITETGELLVTEGMIRCSDLPGSMYARYAGV